MKMSINVAVRICPPSINRGKHVKQQPTHERKPSGYEKIHPHQEENPNIVKTDHESLGADSKHSNDDNEQPLKCCVQPISSAVTPPPGVPSGLVQVGHHRFSVTHALPMNCSQNHVYNETVLPLMTLFMEGFDVSVVTYGQKGCGKTYSLYGKGFAEGVSETEHGIVAHCVREIFTHIGNHPERTYTVNISWVEVGRDIIKDLFGVASVQCMSMMDVFHWLQVGYNLLNNSNVGVGHSLFSLTLEQRWISRGGMIQHRLSTASFTDLGPIERALMLNSMDRPIGIPKDMGLQAVEHVVNILSDPNLLAKTNGKIPYNQTALSAMLKDSFGGRAQTLVMLCVSSLERDVEETLWNMQFGFKAQLVRNTVMINSYSDDNTPVPLDVLRQEIKAVTCYDDQDDKVMLQLAAKRWCSLVSNAEDMLTTLMSSGDVSANEKHQIYAWLFRQQEYEECLKTSEAPHTTNNLDVMHDAEELEGAVAGSEEDLEDSFSSEADTALTIISDQETDNESERSDIDEQFEYLMQNFNTKTDDVIKRNYQEFMETHPRGVMESREERPSSKNEQKIDEECKKDRRLSAVSARNSKGCRRSAPPGSTLSSKDLFKLSRVALSNHSEGEQSKETPENVKPLRKHGCTRLEELQKKLQNLDTNIETRLKQIKDIEETMDLKQSLITELINNNDSRTTKQKLQKKRAKLEAEYEQINKSFNKRLTHGIRDKTGLERLKSDITRLQQSLNDVTSIKDIAGETTQKVKKLQQSVLESKKLIEGLQKKIKKERKLKDILTTELVYLREKQNSKALDKVDGRDKFCEEKRKYMKEVQSRTSNLDQVLKEKSVNLQQDGDHRQREAIRLEIRNLRKTQDHLIDQGCSLDRKLKREKTLSHKEERNLLECEEAIEAIDAVIDFKNELISGNKSIDTTDKLQREQGEQMLMARINNLTSEEMSTLLDKFFSKAIDLSDSSLKLETEVMALEREKEALEWKERMLLNLMRKVELDCERNAVSSKHSEDFILPWSLGKGSPTAKEQEEMALTHQTENFKYLTINSTKTKVTRQSNKLVKQDRTRR